MEERIDLAVRIGNVLDESLVARKLGSVSVGRVRVAGVRQGKRLAPRA